MSLGRWFLLWMVLVTVWVLGASVAVVTLHQREMLLQQLETRGRSVARAVASEAASPGAGPLSLAVLPECVSARVDTSSGALLWTFGPSPAEALAVDPGLIEVREEVELQTADGRMTVRGHLLLSTSRVRAQVLGTGARLVVALGVALAVVLVLGAVLVDRTVEPLRTLAEVARTYRSHRLAEIAVPVSAAGEIRELTVAFQEMAERLADQRRRIFDEMTDGVALVDPGGEITLANRAIEPHLRAVADEVARRAPDGGRHEWEVASGGRRLRCTLTSPPAMDRILVARDVTEWVRAEEHLREAQKMEAVATLAGGVSHDFNNLLAGILLHVRLLERDPAAGAEAVAAIRALASEGAEVVNGLLQFARPEAAERQALDLAGLVAEQEPLLRHVLPPVVRLTTELERPVVVWAAAGDLRRLLLNLVLNARNAMGSDGGLLGVRVAGESQWAVLEVTDTGPGVPQELRERVFEPFFTGRREGRGAGLGLAVVYAIVREHEGEIVIDDGPEGGARFTVRLPLRGEIQPPAAVSEPPGPVE